MQRYIGRGNFPFAVGHTTTRKTYKARHCNNQADESGSLASATYLPSRARDDDTCPRLHVRITPLLVPSVCTIKA
jgi:hypothetical protein